MAPTLTSSHTSYSFYVLVTLNGGFQEWDSSQYTMNVGCSSVTYSDSPSLVLVKQIIINSPTTAAYTFANPTPSNSDLVWCLPTTNTIINVDGTPWTGVQRLSGQGQQPYVLWNLDSTSTIETIRFKVQSSMVNNGGSYISPEIQIWIMLSTAQISGATTPSVLRPNSDYKFDPYFTSALDNQVLKFDNA